MDFIVLSSSRGTTFQAVIDAMKSGALTARCLGLICDHADRECIEKAEAAGLPVRIVERQDGETKADFEARVHEAALFLIHEAEATQSDVLLTAMGWMRILSPWFIAKWPRRILNVHPALLPKFGGKGMYGDHVHETVLQSGDAQSGITIHVMDDGVDTGPVLLQKTVDVEPGESLESLREKVQQLEREWYPKTLQLIETGELPLP